MLYIVIALKAEAQAFVDKYKLHKKSFKGYNGFENENIKLIISGIGVDNAMRATQTLINHYDITDDDIYLNVGICAANNSFEIGELIEISSIEYEEELYTLHENSSNAIKCVESQTDKEIAKILDMESYGFYEAVHHSPAIKNIYILKVVSDHFEPNTVTKDMAKSLIFNKIDAINTIIKFKDTI